MNQQSNFPDWDRQFTLYLLANGLSPKNSVEKEIGGILFFSNLHHGIMVYTSGKLVFYEWSQGIHNKLEEWVEVYSFTGYGNLNLHEFRLLCHITSLIPLKEFTEKSSPVKTIESKRSKLLGSDRYSNKKYLDFNLIRKRTERKKRFENE